MHIEIVTEATDELYDALQRLVPQLTNNNPPPTQEALSAVIRDPASTLMIARDEHGVILGALTFVVYRVPSGVRSIIEDVVVDGAARGQGVGQALVGRAIELARKENVGTI